MHEMHENDACMKLHEECRSVQLYTGMLHINSRGQPGAARSSEKQYTKLVSQRNHEESCSVAFCRAQLETAGT
ncbi:hypothetical protein HaLaN_24399, partial [Haematococcus lacustris]